MSDQDHALVRVEALPVRGAHDDIKWTLLGRSFISDSYYFGVSDEPMDRWPGVPPDGLLRRALADLLSQWLRVILRMHPGDTRYLIFDISDQCTSYLRVLLLDANSVSLNVGWSELEGCTLSPTSIEGYSASIDDFDPKFPEDTVAAWTELVKCVSGQIAALVDGQAGTSLG